MALGKDVEKLQLTDRGERAFEEGLALLDTLREACEGRSTLTLATVSTTLGVMRERITTARTAFDQLAAPA